MLQIIYKNYVEKPSLKKEIYSYTYYIVGNFKKIKFSYTYFALIAEKLALPSYCLQR